MEAKLAFSQDSPPLSIICAAKVAGVPLSVDPSLAVGSAPTLCFSSGESLHGVNPILHYIAHSASFSSFCGQDAIESGHVLEWLEYAPTFLSGSEFEVACSFVDGYLESRTFLVGHGLTIADIVVWSNLAGIGQRWDSVRKSKKYQNLVRWFNSIDSDYVDTLNEVVAAYVGKRGIGKSPAPNFKEKVHDSKDPSAPEVDLPGAKVGEVCVRFAPEPSGYLHIGHAKAALLNKYFAERYQGRLIVRFDDTNPSKESNEFVENLLKDIETLGIKYDAVTYTSDYFPKLMEMAESLIKQGKAYVDDTPKEQMRSERMDGVESKCRNNTVEENLSLWKEMINGTERGMQCCVRGKLDMQDPNKSLRDPVYYRRNTDPHHRVGSKYKVYPTYDFACPFVDALEGVTHALRSSEYHDRNAQYYRILQDMGMRRVEIYEFSRLNMVYTLLSKRKLLWFVQNKKVEDWTDPRFPTVQGIVRRGLKVESLIQFILQQGASKNLNLMEWDKLWTINKKIIDPVCARHTAVLKDQRVIFTLTNGPDKSFVRILPRHKKYEGAGKKASEASIFPGAPLAAIDVEETGEEGMDEAAPSAKPRRDSPLIPPNYVSLRHLQELRLKEKEQQERQRRREEEAALGGVKAVAPEPETKASCWAKERPFGGQQWVAVAHRLPPPRWEGAAKKRDGAIGNRRGMKGSVSAAASASQGGGGKAENKEKHKVSVGTKGEQGEPATASSHCGKPEEKRKALGDQSTASGTSGGPVESADAPSRGRVMTEKNKRKGKKGSGSRSAEAVTTSAPGETVEAADASPPQGVKSDNKGKKKPSVGRRANAAPSSDSPGGKRAHPPPAAEGSSSRRSGGGHGTTTGVARSEGLEEKQLVVEVKAAAERKPRVVESSGGPRPIGGRGHGAARQHGRVWVPKEAAPAAAAPGLSGVAGF